MILRIQIKGGFANLLSIFKQCEKCFGPTYLQCIWLNKKYFGKGEAAIVQSESSIIRALVFHHIESKQGRLIKSVEKDIVFVLEGVIGGLLLKNSKIALYGAGVFLKACPDAAQSRYDNFPISLNMINSNTKEVLAKYSAIFQD